MGAIDNKAFLFFGAAQAIFGHNCHDIGPPRQVDKAGVTTNVGDIARFIGVRNIGWQRSI